MFSNADRKSTIKKSVHEGDVMRGTLTRMHRGNHVAIHDITIAIAQRIVHSLIHPQFLGSPITMICSAAIHERRPSEAGSSRIMTRPRPRIPTRSCLVSKLIMDIADPSACNISWHVVRCRYQHHKRCLPTPVDSIGTRAWRLTCRLSGQVHLTDRVDLPVFSMENEMRGWDRTHLGFQPKSQGLIVRT